jgi:single-strand DNA-binding protein
MYQKIIIVGNLGRDPEMRFTNAGQPVTSLNVATNRKYTGADGQKVKETAWFRVSVWGKMAEVVNTYLKKGSKVMIEGRLNIDPATGGPRVFKREDGSSGAQFEITADNVQFLDTRGENGDHETAPAAEEEIPF